MALLSGVSSKRMIMTSSKDTTEDSKTFFKMQKNEEMARLRKFKRTC